MYATVAETLAQFGMRWLGAVTPYTGAVRAEANSRLEIDEHGIDSTHR